MRKRRGLSVGEERMTAESKRQCRNRGRSRGRGPLDGIVSWPGTDEVKGDFWQRLRERCTDCLGCAGDFCCTCSEGKSNPLFTDLLLTHPRVSACLHEQNTSVYLILASAETVAVSCQSPVHLCREAAGSNSRHLSCKHSSSCLTVCFLLPAVHGAGEGWEQLSSIHSLQAWQPAGHHAGKPPV